MADFNTISAAVKLHLKKQGITMTEAAGVCGITQQGLSTALSGTRPIPAKIARKLADAYGMNVSYLLTGEGDLARPSDQDQEQRGIFVAREKMIEWLDNLTRAVNIQAEMLERWQDSPSKPRLLSHNQTNK